MRRATELQKRCDNIRMQLDLFRTSDPVRYQRTLRSLRTLILLTSNRRQRSAFQSIMDEQKTPPKE